MERRLFIGFLTTSIAALAVGPTDQCQPNSLPWVTPLEKTFQAVIQCVADHPGAEVVNVDDPKRMEIGWGVTWIDSPGYEGYQQWDIRLSRVRESFAQFSQRQDENFTKALSELLKSQAGRHELAIRLREAGEARRSRVGLEV